VRFGPSREVAVARLLRDEARARTRARLVEAAEKLFAAKGFGVGLEEIAETAGYSRGAIYYNFDDKEALFVAVLEKRTDEEIGEISGLLTANQDPIAFLESLKGRGERRRRNRENRRWGLLLAEFWLYALRNERARAVLAEHQRQVRAAYERAIKSIFQRLGIQSPAPLERLSAVIYALDQGLFNQHWIDPEAVPADTFYETLELLIAAAVALDAERSALPTR
jgi:AcrR family transcriptional regulator